MVGPARKMFNGFESSTGLPAGLGHTWDQAFRSKLTERNTRELEAAKVTMTTSSLLATVHNPCRGCVAWEHAETNIVLLFNELCAQFCVFLNSLLLLLVSCDPTFLSHKRER